MTMLLAELTSTSRQVAETGSRLEKIRLLAACLRRLAPDEAEIAVHYLAGRLRQGRIGIGYAALQEALPGEAASESTLMLAEVDGAFEQIARTSGAGAAARRRALLGALLAKATRAEQEFLARLLLGDLRQGALEALVLEALAQAVDLPAAELRRAAMLGGDLAAVARAALAEGAAGLRRFRLRLLTPVQPMLAESAEDVDDALVRLGRASLEFKLDGARVQVHKDGPQVRVFTRSLHDITDAVPEIVEAVSVAPAQRLIADGEALVLRPDGAPQPFQVTMRRFGRKLDVAAMRAELPLTALFFDCLHLDGEDLIDRPQHERFAAAAQALASGLIIPRRVTGDAREAQAFFAEALARGHEGVMAKSLDAPYEAGNRGASWLKVKRAWTLDLVVLAAEWGHGRRQGLLSNLHLGARDPQGGFVMLGKTFKGLTDELLRWQTQKLRELEIGRDAYTVHVRPELVVEVAFNDIQASPHYPGGLALRFARVKGYRSDKRAQDADTIDTVRAIYAGQLARGQQP
jgi:DNA ligase-1